MNGFRRIGPKLKHFVAHLNVFYFCTKAKRYENEEPNDYLPRALNYDHNIDYEELAWNALCEEYKGDDFVEEMKKIIESWK